MGSACPPPCQNAPSPPPAGACGRKLMSGGGPAMAPASSPDPLLFRLPWPAGEVNRYKPRMNQNLLQICGELERFVGKLQRVSQSWPATGIQDSISEGIIFPAQFLASDEHRHARLIAYLRLAANIHSTYTLQRRKTALFAAFLVAQISTFGVWTWHLWDLAHCHRPSPRSSVVASVKRKHLLPSKQTENKQKCIVQQCLLQDGSLCW